MTEKQFWHMIKECNELCNENYKYCNINKLINCLLEELMLLDERELFDFEVILRKKILELEKHGSIYELYSLVSGYFVEKGGELLFNDTIGTDSFLYFRCWFVAKGKDVYDRAISNPEALSEFNLKWNMEECWGEEMLYLSDEIFEEKYQELEGFNESNMIRDQVLIKYPELDYDSNAIPEINPKPEYRNLNLKYPGLFKRVMEES